jgi:arsenate reductase
MLGVPPKTLLRKNDKAYKELELTGDEGDEALLTLMADHPTLLQRPIGILNGKAVVGRPHEKLLELL